MKATVRAHRDVSGRVRISFTLHSENSADWSCLEVFAAQGNTANVACDFMAGELTLSSIDPEHPRSDGR